MPVITKEMSSEMARNKWRPNCYKCGRFIGVGGYYDVVWDGYNGGWEEGYSTCKKHTAVRESEMEFGVTTRGFVRIEFEDANDEECSLQESSAIKEEALLWLGLDEVKPKLFTPGYGWSDIDMPHLTEGQSILSSGRMHLTQSHVVALLPYLQRFAETGKL